MILIAGAIICLIVLWIKIPGGINTFFEMGIKFDKFSLGGFDFSLNMPTFWVTLIYGIFINLQNYGIDQNYVQRYKTTKDEKSAKFSALFGGFLYLPVSLFFFLIGTSLFVFYKSFPGILPDNISSDQVFPYFIVTGLPMGFTGLLIAAIFAAGMSTVATSINSGATVILTDFLQRGKPVMEEKKKMKILYFASFILGVLGVLIGLAMMTVKSALDAWWSLAGIFSGGMLGLFLLGYISTNVKGKYALVGTICGIILIAWISLSGQTVFHNYMTIVLGTIVIFCIGFFLSIIASRLTKKSVQN